MQAWISWICSRLTQQALMIPPRAYVASSSRASALGDGCQEGPCLDDTQSHAAWQHQHCIEQASRASAAFLASDVIDGQRPSH